MKYYENISDLKGSNFDGWSISKKMFNWIINNIQSGSTILELGSGTGTIELSKYYNMISIEHDEKWLNLCKNSKYIYAPLKNGWYDINILKNELKNIKYDVILIDGPPKKYSDRKLFIDNIDLFDKNVIFLIDDTQREFEFELCKLLSTILNKKYKNIKGYNKDFAIIK